MCNKAVHKGAQPCLFTKPLLFVQNLHVMQLFLLLEIKNKTKKTQRVARLITKERQVRLKSQRIRRGTLFPPPAITQQP